MINSIMPSSLWNRKLPAVGRQIDVNRIPVCVVQLKDPIGASVDHEVEASVAGKVPHLVLQLGPVAAVESLPLGGDVHEEECGILREKTVRL